MAALPHHCTRCDARWGGSLTAHCSGCHITVTGLTAFDKHRDGSHAKGRFCLTPEDAGLVITNRLYPCFGLPGAETHYWEVDE